jgi:hypothetical protein
MDEADALNGGNLQMLTALMECFRGVSSSVLGLHYLSTHRRDSLHSIAHGLFFESVSLSSVSYSVSDKCGCALDVHEGYLAHMVEIFAALSLFSSDGRNAVIEVCALV